MAHLHLRIIGMAWLLLSLAGPHVSAAWSQTVLSAPSICASASDRSTSLAETENLVRAEIFDAAECSARRLAAAQPESADAHYLLGYILNRQDQPDESLQQYTIGARYGRPAPNHLA